MAARKPDVPVTETIDATLDAFGRRLYHVRVRRGISQVDVANLTDGAISDATVSRLERGDRRDPVASTLLAICMAYDIDIRFTRRGVLEIQGTNLAGAGSTIANGGQKK